MELPEGFQESLTELVITSLYNYNHAKNSEADQPVDFNKLKDEAFAEYHVGFGSKTDKIKYPLLKNFTNVIVGAVLQEINNLPSNETPNDRALTCINELLEADQETLNSLYAENSELIDKLIVKLYI